ncbi:Uncharacterised protein [Serratia rubidaea]|uniref:Uncharacterized protein n=1 Tax=Serratia rubidaea TaxID=61652 RepID=A0A4U9HTG0_SERRU|nr:Uncharacterised protein [Serratia rubidaea]
MLQTGDNFSRHVAFMHAFVRQHRLTDDIADGENVRHVGAQLLVNVDKAALINRHARFVSIQQFAVRHTADSHQHRVVTLWFRRRFFAFHRDVDTIFFGFYRGHFGFQHQVELLADTLGEHFHHVFIRRRDHLVEHFHHINLGTQRVVNGAHFQTDDAPPITSMRSGTVFSSSASVESHTRGSS